MITGIESINLVPDEILLTGSKVVVQTTEAVDREQVARAVGVHRLVGTLQVSRDGRRLTWTPDVDSAPGWYEFSVDGLTAKSGRRISSGGRVRFGLVNSSAPVPANVMIESMTRLRINRWQVERLPLFAERARGRYVELMKAADRRTGAPMSLAFDETGASLDPDALRAEITGARVKRFGKLGENLDRVLRTVSDDEKVSVAIWAQTEEEVEPNDKSSVKAPDESTLMAVIDRVVTAAGRATGALRDDLSRLGAEVTTDERAPVVYARLDKKEIRRLRKNDLIAAVFLYDPRGFDDLDDSMSVSNSDDVHSLGATGRGIRVAVWERGPDSITDLDIAGTFVSPGAMSAHSRLVHGIISNTEQNNPNGHAPDCDLYSANSYSLSALNWAVGDEACTVINQSFHRDDEQDSDGLSFDDVYKDWLILRPPYPTIIQAAGNGDENEYVNHKGYNSLTVANHNNDASAISSTSVSKNPASPHNDRELPEIGANGTGVAAVGVSDSGTSFASPAVAGIAALIQSEDTILRSWPEGCRAILLAGATRNVSGGTWWQDVVSTVDASDGSGAVNALESHRIVQNRRSRNAAATRRGWDVGILDDGDFDASGYSRFVYKVAVPDWSLGPRRVKVALTWNSKVKEFSLLGLRLPLTSSLEQDLDLKIYDSQERLVAHSQSWDNSYEIAEFDAQRGEEYTIRIRRWSGTGWTWHGIAWTVTGGILDFLELRDMVFEEPIADRLR